MFPDVLLDTSFVFEMVNISVLALAQGEARGQTAANIMLHPSFLPGALNQKAGRFGETTGASSPLQLLPLRCLFCPRRRLLLS
jgi:hypothetical protein